MIKLAGAIAVVIAIVLLLNPVALGVSLNGAGTCLVLGLIVGGLIGMIAG